MELRLVTIKGEFWTEFKIPQKEKRLLVSQLIAMKCGGVFKESTRYVYYRIKGDFLNGRKLNESEEEYGDRLEQCL